MCKQRGRGGRDVAWNNYATSWKKQTWCSSDYAGQRMWSRITCRFLAEQLGKCKHPLVSGTGQRRVVLSGKDREIHLDMLRILYPWLWS